MTRKEAREAKANGLRVKFNGGGALYFGILTEEKDGFFVLFGLKIRRKKGNLWYSTGQGCIFHCRPGELFSLTEGEGLHIICLA